MANVLATNFGEFTNLSDFLIWEQFQTVLLIPERILAYWDGLTEMEELFRRADSVTMERIHLLFRPLLSIISTSKL